MNRKAEQFDGEMTPEQLGEIDRIRKNKHEVADVFSDYQERLQRLVRFRLDARLSTRIEIDDVLQEAYIEIQRRIDDFLAAPNVPFFVWIRQITIQTMIDIQRRHLGAKMRDVKREVNFHRGSVGQTNSFSIAAHLIGNLTSPSQAFARQEKIDNVRTALESMEPMDQEVLVLRHLEELTNAEVANVLQIDKSAASKRYIRALERLRKVVESPAN